MRKNILFTLSVVLCLSLLTCGSAYAAMSVTFHDNNIYNHGDVVHKVVGGLYDNDRSSEFYCTKTGAAFTGTVTGSKSGEIERDVQVFETVDGRLNGKFIFYSPYPDIKMRGFYKNGKRDGIWEFNDSLGKTENEIVYENALTVHSKSYSPSGTVFTEMDFANGFGKSGYVVINGTKCDLYSNNDGVLIKNGNVYCNKDGRPVNGYLLMEDNFYYPLKNGVINGDAILYNGESVFARIPFVNGLRNGVCIEYDPDGSIYSETPYVNGKREGSGREKNMFKTYKDDKLVETKIVLSDEDKITIRTDKNEKPIEYSALLGGKKYRYSPFVKIVCIKGENLYCDAKTQIPYSGIFLINNTHVVSILDGKKEGIGYSYLDGKIYAVENYKNGLLNGLTTIYYDYKNKKIRELVNYVKDKKEGEYKNYNIYGIMYETGIYKDGRKIFSRKYYEDGNLRSVFDYVKETEKDYDRTGKLIRYIHKNEAGQRITEEYK